MLRPRPGAAGPLLFPVGGQTKAETRAHAARWVASPEARFAGGVLRARGRPRGVPRGARPRPGADRGGRGRGQRNGARRARRNVPVHDRSAPGLGVSTGTRSYVIDVDQLRQPRRGGPRQLLARGGLLADRVTWVSGSPTGPTEVTVRIRYRASRPRRVVTCDGGGARVEFRSPRAIAPGQASSSTTGTRCWGGRITKPSARPLEPLRPRSKVSGTGR